MRIALLLLLARCLSASAEARTEDPNSWHQLLGILQYLQSDYPAAAASRSPTELEEQRSFATEAVSSARDLGPPAERFLSRLESIRERVDQGIDPSGVSRDCAALVEEIVQAVGINRSPRRAPNLANGQKLYAVGCAACHGEDGKARVEIAATMQPPPTDLTDPRRMEALTPYRVFNELTFGIGDTAMPSYRVLSESERWDLAFFTFTLSQPPCDHHTPYASLEQLAISTDQQLAAKFGAQHVACFRRQLPSLAEGATLNAARVGVERALNLWGQGKISAARTALLDAYLNGVEPAEPMLRIHHGRLLSQLERAFQRTRLAIESNNPAAGAEGRELLALIDRANQPPPTRPDFWSVFWLALLVIVREGFEASVVVAALLAALHKMNQRQHARVVHAGWILAIGLGIVAYLFARQMINGADRELLEGATALVAVALLVYASLWLNARVNVRKFMGKLRDRMQSAAGTSGALGLFTVSFTAVLRESFETALFIQGLSIDSPSAAAWGAAAGAGVLVGLVVVVNRVGYRLPMKPLFNASTVLLMATAVILLGKGIHALQTVGTLPLHAIGTFQVEALGVYADAYSLSAQAALAFGSLIWMTLRRRNRSGTSVQDREGSQGIEVK